MGMGDLRSREFDLICCIISESKKKSTEKQKCRYRLVRGQIRSLRFRGMVSYLEKSFPQALLIIYRIPPIFFPRAFSGPCSGTAWCLHSYCQAYNPMADLLAAFRAQLLILQIPPNIALVVIDFTNEGYYRVWKTVTKQCYETE